MTIRKNIETVQGQIRTTPSIGADLRTLAVKAIYGGMPKGIASDDWKGYMKHFATTDVELARLTTESTDCHPYTKPARAYLVANALCLPATEKDMLNGIEQYLDETLTQPQHDDDASDTR